MNFQGGDVPASASVSWVGRTEGDLTHLCGNISQDFAPKLFCSQFYPERDQKVPVKEQLSLAFANLNMVSTTLGEIKYLVDRRKYPMLVEEYFHMLLTLGKVNEAIVNLELVGQGHRNINNRF